MRRFSDVKSWMLDTWVDTKPARQGSHFLTVKSRNKRKAALGNHYSGHVVSAFSATNGNLEAPTRKFPVWSTVAIFVTLKTVKGRTQKISLEMCWFFSIRLSRQGGWSYTYQSGHYPRVPRQQAPLLALLESCSIQYISAKNELWLNSYYLSRPGGPREVVKVRSGRRVDTAKLNFRQLHIHHHLVIQLLQVYTK